MNVPQQKPRDKEKIRQQYLANLQLENSNNTLNLNASKMYRATGVSSQVATTMTGVEKLAGLEGLKQIGADFIVSKRFANPLSAKEAVDKMTPDEVRFLNEYSEFIGGNFKGRNVPSTVIVQYIRKLKRKMEETEGVDYGIQQSSGSGILLTGLDSAFSIEDIQDVLTTMLAHGLPEPAVIRVRELMEQTNAQCLTKEQYQRAQQEGPEQFALVQKANSQFRESIPTVEELLQQAESGDAEGMVQSLLKSGILSDIYSQIGVAASSGPVSHGAPSAIGETGVGESIADRELAKKTRVFQGIEAIKNLPTEERELRLTELQTETGITITSQKDLISALEAEFNIAYPFQSNSDAPSAPEPGGGGGAGTPTSPPTDLTATSAPSAAPAPAPPSETGSADSGPTQEDMLFQDAYDTAKLIEGYIGAAPTDTAEIQQVIQKLQEFHHRCHTLGYTSGNRPDAITADFQRNGINAQNFEKADNYIAQIANATADILKTGAALSKPAAPPKGSNPNAPLTISSSGTEQGNGLRMTGKGIGRRHVYEKPKPYKQFGRHLIHRHKLDDGILMIKYPSGARHPEMPTQKISDNLTRVFKEMADGRMPQYHHFEGLGIKEKELLHKVVRHTQFQNMEVPSPDKEALDKELDRFDILRGEIEAGNDNKEIIKEFKVMLMKFMRQGRIPKAQVNEIMEHLLMMGH